MDLTPRYRIQVFLVGIALCLGGCIQLPIEIPADQNQVIFKDDFSSNEAGWNLSQSDAGGAEIVDGMARLYLIQPHTDVRTTPGLKFSDVRIDVDAVKSFGSDNNYFGIICRDQGNGNFYSFLISSDGYYGISKVKDGGHELISGDQMRRNDDIQSGTAPNHLSVICQGDQLTLAVNGIVLQTVQDGEYQSGDFGLIAGSSDDSDIEVRFDQFLVTKPEVK